MSGEQVQGVKMIAMNRIAILNPRVRSKRSFDELVANIADIGLKKPITVARRDSDDGPRYDLVCGQGRYEAFQVLGQKEIPAFVIEADEHECLIKSLVENCARRKHSAMELFQDIQRMKHRGYTGSEIAKKTGLNVHYVRDILRLIEKGEERLLRAVESGQIPITVAVEIAEADDAGIQEVLQEAYENKILRGRKLKSVKHLIEQRRRRGKGMEVKGPKRTASITSHSLVKTYRQDADRKKLMVRKASATKDRLTFVIQALRSLCSDENFHNLLRAESLDTLPKNLVTRIQEGGLA